MAGNQVSSLGEIMKNFKGEKKIIGIWQYRKKGELKNGGQLAWGGCRSDLIISHMR